MYLSSKLWYQGCLKIRSDYWIDFCRFIKHKRLRMLQILDYIFSNIALEVPQILWGHLRSYWLVEVFVWPADQSGIGWTITDIHCHFFIQPALSGSKIETRTLVASYDWYPRTFCPRKGCWGQEMENFEACPGDCCQRHPTAAGRNIRCAVVCCTSLSSVSPSMPRPLHVGLK